MCKLTGKYSNAAGTTVYTGHKDVLEALYNPQSWKTKNLRSKLKGFLLSDKQYKQKASRVELIDESIKEDFVSATGIKSETSFLGCEGMTCCDINNADVMHNVLSNSKEQNRWGV